MRLFFAELKRRNVYTVSRSSSVRWTPKHPTATDSRARGEMRISAMPLNAA